MRFVGAERKVLSGGGGGLRVELKGRSVSIGKGGD